MSSERLMTFKFRVNHVFVIENHLNSLINFGDRHAMAILIFSNGFWTTFHLEFIIFFSSVHWNEFFTLITICGRYENIYFSIDGVFVKINNAKKPRMMMFVTILSSCDVNYEFNKKVAMTRRFKASFSGFNATWWFICRAQPKRFSRQ